MLRQPTTNIKKTALNEFGKQLNKRRYPISTNSFREVEVEHKFSFQQQQ